MKWISTLDWIGIFAGLGALIAFAVNHAHEAYLIAGSLSFIPSAIYKYFTRKKINQQTQNNINMNNLLVKLLDLILNLNGSKGVTIGKIVLTNLSAVLLWIENPGTTPPPVLTTTGNAVVDELIELLISAAKYDLFPDLSVNVKAAIDKITNFIADITPDYNTVIAGLEGFIDMLTGDPSPAVVAAVNSMTTAKTSLQSTGTVQATAKPGTIATPVQQNSPDHIQNPPIVKPAGKQVGI